MAHPGKKRRIVTAANTKSRVWTGDALLDRALFLAGFKEEHLRHALVRTLEALDAETPTKTLRLKDGAELVTEGGPDHAIRLRAAENLFDWVGFKGKRERESGTGRPVAVTINLTAAPESRPALSDGRLAVHLARNGSSNGKHAPPD